MTDAVLTLPDGSALITMGFVRGAVGIRGWVKIGSDTEYLDSLLDYGTWYLIKGKQRVEIEVETGKVVNNKELQVKFVGCDDRNQAELWQGYTIAIARADFEETEDGEYYWTDLIGMSVINQDGIVLGNVHSLLQTGAHDVLVIRGGEHGEKLIPFIEHFVGEVSLDAKTIQVEWGLDY